MALLEIENLSLSIYGEPILRSVSLALEQGEILGLVGESGSGKSLTALSILRLLPRGSRMSGSIRLNGRELSVLSERSLQDVRGADVGIVFQEPMTALNPLKTIGAQVAECFTVHRQVGKTKAMAHAVEALARVGLTAPQCPPDRFPHELSGGQRQRVVIAMAVALRPKLLIADEPTSALDVTTQAQILDLMKSLAQEDGAGLLLITHDLAVVAEMADKVAVMREGEIVEQGGNEAFFRGMAHPYSQALLKASIHVPKPRRDEPVFAQEQEPILAADALERVYRGRRPLPWLPAAQFIAVNKVNLGIAPGESVGLVGESGCGKSTLSRALLGLEQPQGGRVLYRGRDAATLTNTDVRRLRRDVQVVFQDPYGSFDPRYKAGRLVGEPLHLFKGELSEAECSGRVLQALEEVGLQPDDADKYPHEFSGGQRQRLAIARALVTRPALVVLDEPVSALDAPIRAQVLDLLADLQERHGLAYLFVSHDLSVVKAITDRVLVMRNGRIVEEGATQEVFDNPQHEYTKALLAASPDLQRILRERNIAMSGLKQ